MRTDWTGRTRALWELWTQRSGMNRSPMVLRWLEPLSTNRVGTEESYEKLKCMIVKWAMNVRVLEKMEKHEYLERNYSNFDMGWSVWERQRKA